MLSKIGTYMALFGVLAIVLGFFDYSPKILYWIYNWGNITAWIIKLALVLIGGVLYLIGTKNEDNIGS